MKTKNNENIKKIIEVASKNHMLLSRLSVNPTKWSNTFKQFIGKSRRII